MTIGASVLAMGISFGVVRWLTGQLDDEPPPNPVVQRQVLLLRGFSNDLTRACNGYAGLARTDDGAFTPDAQSWIDRIFRRDIRFLQQRMEEAPMERIHVYGQLHAAVARCATMSRHPGDRALRDATLGEAARAVGAVNAYIDGLGMGKRAGRPPIRIDFD